MRAMAKRLTNKQRAFVIHYIANGFNATQAARDAGYKTTGGSIRAVASENLSKPYIAQAILAEMDRLLMPAEEVAGRLAQIARGEPYADIEFTSSDVLRALIHIGKTHQMFIDRLAVDWRAELREQGIEDAGLFEQMVQRAYEELTARQAAEKDDEDDDGD